LFRPRERLSRRVSDSEKGREACVLAGTRASGYPDAVYSFCLLVSTEFLNFSKTPGEIPAGVSSFRDGEPEGLGLRGSAHSNSRAALEVQS
jgi:hypothetical protein